MAVEWRPPEGKVTSPRLDRVCSEDAVRAIFAGQTEAVVTMTTTFHRAKAAGDESTGSPSKHSLKLSIFMRGSCYRPLGGPPLPHMPPSARRRLAL